MFDVDLPLYELIIRGAALYVGFIVVFRILPRRTAGEMAPMDLVFLLLVTETASHSLGDFTSITSGVIQIGVFIILDYSINKLSYHFKFIRRLVAQKPLPIIEDGILNKTNMKKEALTEDELLSCLRMESISDINSIKTAKIEGNGKISVINYEK
ncbi:DUF421 domain-containing protein [Pseudochrobactrum sp. MP213Fo]|uniref:DUF421 domain-containing protein n=1 Tax=Pseudochrobactrum sp. MP213Fo TaxID=3022250 RepID=UPI003BA31536